MDYYERYWKGYFENNGILHLPPVWVESNLRRITDIIKPYCQGDILDIGCGDGAFTFHLSKLSESKRVRGVDLSHAAIAQAKNRYSGIDFEVASATRLPFPKESFDFIIMSGLIEHVIDTEQMFKEANRVLKPGGGVLITTTDFNLLKKMIIAIFFWEKYFYPMNPHIRFFTKSTLKCMLNKTGFKIIKYNMDGSYFGIMPKGQIVIAKKVAEK